MPRCCWRCSFPWASASSCNSGHGYRRRLLLLRLPALAGLRSGRGLHRTITGCWASATRRTCSTRRRLATRNPRTIGPAIVWSPFFATGHLVAGRLAARGRKRQHRRHLLSLSPGGLRRRSRLRAARLLVHLSPDSALLQSPARRYGNALVVLGSFMLWYREGAEHDARAVDGRRGRVRMAVGRDARHADAAAVGAARRARGVIR